jgi:GTPase
VQRASLVLHVSDASSLTSAEQDAQVEVVLRELEADKKPRLHVQNKLDLVPAAERSHLANDVSTVYVSAAKQTGLPELLARIDAMLDQDPIQRVKLRVPQSEGKVLAQLEAKSRIYERAYKDGAVELELDAPESVVRKLGKWTVKEALKTKRRG